MRLSQDVVGKIAAGEVVERPAAAVKELVENAIDAQATVISVELTDGGITSIRVSDNGTGIPAGQLKMAFERHATSKLSTAEELFSIHTLGFRGEALASIAAIAKVTCVSRTADAEYGMKAQVEAGRFLDFSEAASPVGTTITVKDLFFNAPVRLKFLKKPAAEAALVSDYLMRLILSRPDIAFRFASQGKTVYRSTGDGALIVAVYAVYGRETAQGMRKVSGFSGGVAVDGLVGVQELARGNRQQQSFFVNGRYFRDDLLSKALESAAEGYVMIGRFPVCALNLTMAYEQVDVNVHPNKLEVRFQNPAAVMQAVETAVRDALQAETFAEKIAPPINPPRPRCAAGSKSFRLRRNRKPMRCPLPWNPSARCCAKRRGRFCWPGRSKKRRNHGLCRMPSPSTEPVQETIPGTNEFAPIRFIGAVFQTYLLFEAGRPAFAGRPARGARAGAVRPADGALYRRNLSQRLLTPMLLTFPAKDVAALLDKKDELETVGFELDVLDATSVIVRATPVILGESEPVRELLVDILDDQRGKAAGATRDRIRQRVAQTACKHAIKGGDPLSQADVESLIRQMLE